MKHLIPAALLLAAGTASLAQQVQQPAASVQQPVSKDEARKTATMLAEALAANTIYSEVGERYAAALRAKAAAGEYDAISDPAQLAKKLTDDLQAAVADGHLRILPPGAAVPMPRMGGGAAPASIEAAKWIADGVAYIRFNSLAGDPDTAAAVDRFMREHAEAKALIIDSRPNRGGGSGPTDVMLPYLFGKPTVLVHMDTRAGPDAAGFAPFAEGPLVRRVTSPSTVVRRERLINPHPTEARLRDAKIFYLTSKRTASAAETFALIFKRTKRGTVIGEATAGAGHFVRPYKVGDRFTAIIPIGRTFDPDTGKGFERTGVVPDVAVPADQALHEALKLAGVTDPAKLAEAVASAS